MKKNGRENHVFPNNRRLAASPIAPLAVLLFCAGCKHVASGPADPAQVHPSGGPELAVMPADALVPSPRLIVGRVLATAQERGFAFVELVTDPPTGALEDGSELTTRTLDLRETARLRTSHYVRGRTLGTKIVSGQPSPGDEVVWLAP